MNLLQYDVAHPVLLPRLSTPCRILVRDSGTPLIELTLPSTLGEDVGQRIVEAVAPLVRLRRRLGAPAINGDAAEISVVVCTRNRPAHLNLCLTAIKALDPCPPEVLVVDNASTGDETRTVAAAHGVSYVQEPRPGLDRARNRGWHSTSGNIVAYLDDDTRADPGWAGALARSMAVSGADVVTGLVLPAEMETGAQRWFEAQGGMRKGFVPTSFHRETSPVGFESYRLGLGANMAFRRSVLDTIGGFDDRLDVGTATRGGGDLDALYAAIEHGFLVRYEPRMMVRHVHRRRATGLVKQSYDNGVGFSGWLAKLESTEPERAQAIRHARRLWWARRHVRGVAQAVGSRQPVELVLAVAHMAGAVRGAAAFRAEAGSA